MPAYGLDKGFIKMKILYLADNINANDGSSVHCRAFVESVRQLGHHVQTYPPIGEVNYEFRKYHEPREKTLSYYLKKLKKLNINILLYYIKKTNGYVDEFITILQSLTGSFKEYRDLNALVKMHNPDVIIFRYKIFKCAAIWISRLHRIPLLVEVNALRSMESKLCEEPNKISFITRRAEYNVIKSADRAFTVSKPIKDFIDKNIKSNGSCVIPNGVDINLFNPNKFDREIAKDKLGLKGKVVLGFVGSYKVWHGLDIAIDVIDSLSKNSNNYHLLLIGNGQCFIPIKKKVIDRNLSFCVTQIDYVPHAKIAEYLASFDYALMTYPDIKPFYFSPLKMFEYMAMEVPVIATKIGQIKDIIENNRTGILVYPPTAENFVKVINEHRKDLKQIGVAARNLMVKEYSWLQSAMKVISICEEVKSGKMKKLLK